MKKHFGSFDISSENTDGRWYYTVSIRGTIIAWQGWENSYCLSEDEAIKAGTRKLKWILRNTISEIEESEK